MILLASLCLSLAASRARGQGAPPGPIHSGPGAAQEQAQGRTPELTKKAIRVRAEEVIAPVVVRGHAGEMILSLSKKDFHIYDNGVEQSIGQFGLGGEPLAIVLAVETSSRVAPLLPAVRSMGIIFSEIVMGRTAEAAILGYDDTVNVLEKFTTDSDAIQKTINHLPAGPPGARLYDAMARGVFLLEQTPSVRRRVLLVVGEAHDDGSQSKLGEVLRAAQLANVTIYSIGLSTTAAEMRSTRQSQTKTSPSGPPGTFPVPEVGGQGQVPSIEEMMQDQNIDLLALAQLLVRTGKNALGPNSLAVACKATGGLLLSPKKDAAIQKAMDSIGGELHAEYTLGYRPPGHTAYGYHEIRVTVDRPGTQVRTRPGYYLAPPAK